MHDVDDIENAVNQREADGEAGVKRSDQDSVDNVLRYHLCEAMLIGQRRHIRRSPTITDDLSTLLTADAGFQLAGLDRLRVQHDVLAALNL